MKPLDDGLEGPVEESEPPLGLLAARPQRARQRHFERHPAADHHGQQPEDDEDSLSARDQFAQGWAVAHALSVARNCRKLSRILASSCQTRQHPLQKMQIWPASSSWHGLCNLTIATGGGAGSKFTWEDIQ